MDTPDIPRRVHPIADVVGRVDQRLSGAAPRPADSDTVPTGFPSVDRILGGGLRRRDLVVSSSVNDEGEAVLSVVDTGAGVDESAAAKLFQPFVTTKPQGMGVGLSISRTIVEAHGGRIWTEPNPGGGAIFRFTLRMAEEQSDGP